ncbi:hypothetical protein DFQ27_000941 [Actinomortierella ambigua]|uniref:Uncharacterized protein n=1 Tax=Actinomortierella ambigua TaxID=1343610 RepID=A0A9P6QDN1_9FUNG|nr:hypothetical protein DFQ27_000941 [Actinomortierella ambigua]
MVSSQPLVFIQGSAKWITAEKALRTPPSVDTTPDTLAVYQRAARALAIYNGRDASRSMAYKLRGLGLVVPAATQPASNLTHHIKVNGDIGRLQNQIEV